MKLILCLILILLTSCSTISGLLGDSEISTVLSPSKVYRRDLRITLDGQPFSGVGVVRKKEQYNIVVKSYGKLDLFTLSTCHREVTRVDAARAGAVAFIYKPVSGIEDRGACPIEFAAYDKTGRHSWGLVEIQTDEETVTASVRCNGSVKNYKGVSICQSRAGLFQEIAFRESVEVSPDPGCDLPKTEGSVFRFEMSKGLCVYAFMNEIGDIHRLTTLGYESIIVR